MTSKTIKVFSKEKERDNNSNKRNLVVKIARCPQNHPCPSVNVCPVGALSQINYEAHHVDMDKCIKCEKCVKYCPMNALILE